MHDRGLVTTAGGNLGPLTNVTNTETWSHDTRHSHQAQIMIIILRHQALDLGLPANGMFPGL